MMLSAIDGMGVHKAFALEIQAENGITNPKVDAWSPHQSSLYAFKQIAEKKGGKTLNLVEEKIPEHVDFQPDVDNFEKALG
ncbi:hypothetical protein JW930_02350 [Candidatus Woesearchaeota archaeon]|nr:hypothetical protein [Candidatus Woesearchaeota archaeon]